jgi:hypothetical protein
LPVGCIELGFNVVVVLKTMSHFIDIIHRKRDGGELSKKDIQSFIEGIVTQEVDRAQLGEYRVRPVPQSGSS